MRDLIERQAAIDTMCRTYCSKWRCQASSCKGVRALKDLPAQQAKTGHWMPINAHTMMCSICGEYSQVETHYCANCGARMG